MLSSLDKESVHVCEKKWRLSMILIAFFAINEYVEKCPHASKQ